MNILDRAIAAVSPRLGFARAVDRARTEVLKAANDGQLTASAGNRSETRWRGASRMMRWAREWFPSLGSGTTDLPSNERRTLTARSRDAMRGHAIARAAITRCRTNIVGTGLIPHSAVDGATLGLSDDEARELNALIDREFALYAENPAECDAEATLDFYQQQALTLVSALLAGDCFALTPWDERPGCIYGLKVQLVEADRVSNKDESPNTARMIDGVELDTLGAPVAYHIRNAHPADPHGTQARWERVLAFGPETGRRRVLHVWNEKDRIGAVRGAPYLAPILEPLKQLERYSSAELMAAVVQSLMTVFIQPPKETVDADNNPLPPLEGATTNTEAGDDAPSITLGNGAVVSLAPGETANMVNPTRPNANFDPFFTALVKQIGACLELPVDELLLSYQASYSAARAAMLQAWRFYTMRRWWLVQQFCAPLRALWFDEAVARGRIPVVDYSDPVRRAAYVAAIWVGPARGAMDEDKEADAAKKRIEAGLSNETIETAALTGEDWKSVQATRQRELAIRARSSAPDAVKASAENYGTAVRAGAITPQVQDEEDFRVRMGLPAVSDDARNAWEEDGGARRPITLQSKKDQVVPDPTTEEGTPPDPPPRSVGDDLLVTAVESLVRVHSGR
jgi:lambda family phage portal protein